MICKLDEIWFSPFPSRSIGDSWWQSKRDTIHPALGSTIVNTNTTLGTGTTSMHHHWHTGIPATGLAAAGCTYGQDKEPSALCTHTRLHSRHCWHTGRPTLPLVPLASRALTASDEGAPSRPAAAARHIHGHRVPSGLHFTKLRASVNS